MTNTTKNHTGILQVLAGLYSQLESRHDRVNCGKMKQLIKKAEEEEVQLAFCGHFSAGKSSMINYLMGQQVLPSSPVPTSANIVKVKKGEDAVIVYFFDGTHTIFNGQHDMKEIKAFCRNGDRIQAIHIHSDHFPLPDDCAVLDTPGIDSTDDAHRISTESTLHLADIILYVMDYNHVQSQENFLFAKKMQESGKKLYLVVNQIDKHDPDELDFASFQHSTAEAFSQWGIEPEGIFYTSLRDLDNPTNQIAEVQRFIQDRIAYERTHLDQSILTSAAQLSKDHLAFLEDNQEEQRKEASDIIEGLSIEQRETISSVRQQKEEELASLRALPGKMHLEWIDRLDDLLKNAYLLTAESRELVKSFLESQQPQFKMGLFFSKGKTDTEKMNREDTLRAELEERVKTQLIWHLREFANSILSQSNIDSAELEAAAQELDVEVNMEQLKSLVAKQSDITGQYVLRFSDIISDHLKGTAKKIALAYLLEVRKVMAQQLEGKIQAMEAIVRQYHNQEEAIILLDQLDAYCEAVQQEMKSTLENEHAGDWNETEALLKQFRDEEKSREIQFEREAADEEPDSPIVSYHEETPEQLSSGMEENSLSEWHSKLRAAMGEIGQLAGFTSLLEDMEDKAERLANQSYTIALFGAFSAGKSSFANALLGEKVLPVSPNPTTAVINKVMAPPSADVHKHAKIEMKSADMLLEDVSIACKALGYTPADLEDAYQFGLKFDDHGSIGDGSEKAHLSFVRAFCSGYSSLKQKLGTVFTVDYHEYTSFAAEEAKSCFVSEISLYFDCPMTREGIVLVDTPGADSINARHTNAAFHYIKNSDAILFVTYYNHPFAKSDREFLIQLGRVKDSFAMDKMFFLCNAIDLAQTEDELADVIGYIRQQLESFGIRFPRLFPISSKEALNELQGGHSPMSHPFLKDSGMPQFHQAFAHFIQHELVELACASARAVIKHAEGMLMEMIEAASSSKEEKEQKLMKLAQEHSSMKQEIVESTTEIEESKMSKESDELQYYIFQRVFLRYSDFFKESFNPAVLQDDGRDLKQALRKAINELIESVAFDFEQEMRATSLRLERYMNKLVVDKQAQYQQIISHHWKAVQIGEYRLNAYEVPVYEKAFVQLTDRDFKKELSLFKNPKSFFEKNEKQKMADALQQSLQVPAKQYLDGQGAIAKQFYTESLVFELEGLKNQALKKIDEALTGYRAVLQDHIDIGSLATKEEALRHLLE
ncbi:dynamin family protein [Bacillus sp. 1P06AnD]|uniref:dynamin family protein n=1 Tax=Bacillus sp. 1P06AnD TaxID=3132208 RepID=UPI0039A05643